MGGTGASHNGHYKEYCLLRCDGMYSGRNKATASLACSLWTSTKIQTFKRHMCQGYTW